VTGRGALHAAHARPWRFALLAYLLALATATHWPQLQLGDEIPATDKTLHFVAFGGLAFLVWRAKVLRSRLAVVAVALAWTVLDEVSQGIPALGRFVSIDDAVAGALGVLVVGAWLWALRPIGAERNRMRQSLDLFAFDDLFRAPRTWLLFGSIVLAGAAPVAVVWLAVGGPPVATAFRIAAIVCGAVAAGVLFARWRATRRRATIERRCFECGRSAARGDLGPDGRGACPGCGAPLHESQWLEPPSLTLRAIARNAVVPALALAVVLAAIFAALALADRAYAHALASGLGSRALPRFVRAVATLPRSLVMTVDLAAILLLLAVAARMYRRRVARIHDRPVRCAWCGHDLRGTPAERGLGRCGECGAPFTRLEALPP
jgi:VanZ family protein